MLVSSVKRSALMQFASRPATLARGVSGSCARRLEKCADRARLLGRPPGGGAPLAGRDDLDRGLAVPENEHAFTRKLDFPDQTGKSLVGFTKIQLLHGRPM